MLGRRGEINTQHIEPGAYANEASLSYMEHPYHRQSTKITSESLETPKSSQRIRMAETRRT